MGIRAHPRLTSRETSLGHHGTSLAVAPGRWESSGVIHTVPISYFREDHVKHIPSEPRRSLAESVSEGSGRGMAPSSATRHEASNSKWSTESTT